jgi:hypothetical protein
MVFLENESMIGGDIMQGRKPRPRTPDALARREKGRANTEREGSSAMAAMAERAHGWSRSGIPTVVEMVSLGSPRFAGHAGGRTR